MSSRVAFSFKFFGLMLQHKQGLGFIRPYISMEGHTDVRSDRTIVGLPVLDTKIEHISSNRVSLSLSELPSGSIIIIHAYGCARLGMSSEQSVCASVYSIYLLR